MTFDSGYRVLILGAALWLGLPVRSGAQGQPVKVSYDVEFSVQGSLLDPNCTATGTDVLSGTLVGLEPVPTYESGFYVGTLARTTRITICGTRGTASGEDVVCTMEIAGNGFADVILTVEPDSAGAYFQYIEARSQWAELLPPPPSGPTTSTVTGTCDPEEMAEVQTSYDNGDTAGSPNGQPIELRVLRLPRSGFPVTFAPQPPESIWSLTIKSRR